MRDRIVFHINGKRFEIGGESVFTSLSNFLRLEQSAVGTKIVCEEGDCGACSVLLGREENGHLVYRPVNACIQYMYQLDLTHIVTIEGLKDNGDLNPVQEAMVTHQGAQCGFCTPGFVVAMCAMIDDGKAASPQKVKDATTGNLCRCTGYDPIVRAGCNIDLSRWTPVAERYPEAPLLKDCRKYQSQPVRVEYDGRVFYSPTTLEEACRFKGENPKTVIVQGGTDVGVACNKRGLEPQHLLSLNLVSGLETLTMGSDTLEVGARVPLTMLEEAIETRIPEFYKMLEVYGSPQIKNAGTLAGNIGNGSPIADSLPFLFVMNAEVEFTGLKGIRRININRLYKGYKTMDVTPDEIITKIHIPLPKPEQVLKLYKISRRKHMDISTFAAAFLMMPSPENTVQEIRIAYGGVGPVVLRLAKTEDYLRGKPITLETFENAGLMALDEIAPISDVRGASEFRLQLAENILQKFFYDVTPEREVALV